MRFNNKWVQHYSTSSTKCSNWSFKMTQTPSNVRNLSRKYVRETETSSNYVRNWRKLFTGNNSSLMHDSFFFKYRKFHNFDNVLFYFVCFNLKIFCFKNNSMINKFHQIKYVQNIIMLIFSK